LELNYITYYNITNQFMNPGSNVELGLAQS